MNRDSQRTLVAGEGRNGMRGDANGACDLFAPVEIGEEVLAESLACHGWNSVAGQKRGDRGLGIEDRHGCGRTAGPIEALGKRGRIVRRAL
jgi:hypothetical protein